MQAFDNLHRDGLYDPKFERDNCGWGLITQMDGVASHSLVETALTALARLTHRGAIAADGLSGDGCGLLISKPDVFLRKVAKAADITLSANYAAGIVFLDPNHDADQRANFEAQIVDQGLEVAGWRSLDINTDVIGEQAKAQLPNFVQVFVNAPASLDADEFRRRLFVARRRHELGENAAYVCSLSPDVLLYKGLVMPANLPKFYADLADPDCTASIAVFHQRFSTNTLPQWRLAQPFRMLAHNGEINTIQGNRNWARARGRSLKSTALPELSELHPIVTLDGSDSMSLDNMLEAMVLGGIDLFQAMRILVPPAWQNVDQMDPDLRAFLEFNSMHMEPWDGPAGIVFTDGRYACCTMDRNGLRPARYVVTNDRTITLASEVGVWDYDEANVTKKGRLKPGQMLGIDTETGALMMPSQVDDRLKRMHPYAKWLQKHSRRLHSRLRDVKVEGSLEGEQYQKFEKLFDVSFEERDQVIRPCCEGGQEPVGSMGDDTPFPVMSHQIRSIYDNFRQQFAQVTNPPIDPLREAIVMSLETCLGAEANLFEATENSAKRLKIRSPILSREKFATLMAMGDEAEYKHERFDLYFDPSHSDYKTALSALVDRAVEASKGGARLLVLSDRNYQSGLLPIHAALAVGALQNRLIDSGQRVHTNIIVETATARDSHHMCVLLGYGATCIYPYLAYDIIADLHRCGDVDGELEQLEQNYRKGINKGILKILSKMGISTIASYRSAQLFEIVGLHGDVVDMCFKGTTSRVAGATFEHLQTDAEGLAKRAEDPMRKTNQGGLLKYIHDGEYHAYNPDVVQTLQAAVRSGQWSDYEKYRDQVDNRPAAMLRDLLQLTSDKAPISIDEVEPVSEIVKRFDSAGMSLGALSPEAHETLAEAMNRLGARSNSGEGGEDAERYGTLKMSKIKQIASGRFGVTPHYLVNAEVLQIKVAQGAKPGEGGQLPGHKVDTLIARLRHSVPGVSLISPPPHHDIYSIEDLAQLIFDLKQVNPEALVSVKLVSEPGVGTIAAGVAKAYADLITISGYDGGTGASPLTSVKYAGSPWELGMSETHQMLRANGLREKVRVQADGGLKTGLDVIKAAILGAESFGFGTGPMIAMGCKFLRICHLNNCATGVATQNKILRMRHFNGDVEKVMNYMTMIAEDVRQHMASIGVRNLEDLIGRTQYLKPIEGFTDKQRALDLSAILSDGGMGEDRPRFCQVPRNEPYDKGELAEEMLSVCKSAIDNKSGGRFEFNIKNINRSIGARLSGEISRVHGANGLADAPIDVVLRGTAGQSFGVWNAHGLNLHLYGDANDYVGKGMNGGKIVIRPAENSAIDTRRSVIVGNTCLYGATGGQIFAAGLAGERFGVRNSGAVAVVEGLGDHGCEYMTGGCVVSLGETGVNFGAGMTGGLAFVLDMNRNFVDCYNHELIDIHRVTAESMEPYRMYLQELVAQYAQETGSEWGQEVSDNFYRYAAQFWLVKPKALELPQLFSTLRAAA